MKQKQSLLLPRVDLAEPGSIFWSFFILLSISQRPNVIDEWYVERCDALQECYAVVKHKPYWMPARAQTMGLSVFSLCALLTVWRCAHVCLFVIELAASPISFIHVSTHKGVKCRVHWLVARYNSIWLQANQKTSNFHPKMIGKNCFFEIWITQQQFLLFVQ